jgi:hypothetical protein
MFIMNCEFMFKGFHGQFHVEIKLLVWSLNQCWPILFYVLIIEGGKAFRKIGYQMIESSKFWDLSTIDLF